MTMPSGIDFRTVLELLVTIVSAVGIVATIKRDLYWFRYWMQNHEQQDAANFDDIRKRLGNLERGSK